MEKYFLYIDILGFVKLVESDPSKIDDIYEVVASLSLHNHDQFKAIIFSDTILVYNLRNPVNTHDHQYIVMYLCEFVEDLQSRLTGRDIYFRAILTQGGFNHYELNGIPCYYGSALLEAYYSEKKIECLGLFISDSCLPYCNIYKCERYSENFSFVYLTRAFEEFARTLDGVFPISDAIWEDFEYDWRMAPDAILLQNIYNNSRNSNLGENARKKHIEAFKMYEKRYPFCVKQLVDNNFLLTTISESVDWKQLLNKFPEKFSMVKKQVS